MIPLTPSAAKPIEPEFWALARAFEQLYPDPPIPFLRAFVEIGRVEGIKESDRSIKALQRQIKGLRSKLAYYIRKSRALDRSRKNHFDRRNTIWGSEILAKSRIGDRKPIRELIKDAERKQILLMVKSGLSVKETAARIGISVPTLYRRMPKAAKINLGVSA